MVILRSTLFCFLLIYRLVLILNIVNTNCIYNFALPGSVNNSFDQNGQSVCRMVMFTGLVSSSQLDGHGSFVTDEDWVSPRHDGLLSN